MKSVPSLLLLLLLAPAAASASDLRPTDWAYQALSNLIERYGCVAGYPDGTFKGGRAMTRFEAAALLNACLDRVTEVTDELKRPRGWPGGQGGRAGSPAVLHHHPAGRRGHHGAGGSLEHWLR
jgi:hypothetical protein